MTTIRDVAKASGFSSATVSIVLNNAPLAQYIPAATKARIQQAARKLGYRPNLFARSLRSQRSHAVGVMVFDVTDPYCTLILRGIENTLFQSSYVPILTDAHNNRGRFERYLEMLLDRRVEGLIVLANWLFLDVNVLADLEKSRIPTVMIGRELRTGSVSSVIVDNKLGSSMAIEHLYSLGHRKIAFIRGPRTLGDSAPRWRGVREFAQSKGLRLDNNLIVDLPESRAPISGFDAGYNLTRDLLRGKHQFTALMAFDDLTAFGAIRALTNSGIKVPDDCAVIGFDDVPPSSLSTPTLTTIRQPMEAMGEMAVSIMLDNIRRQPKAKPRPALHRKVTPELVVRESTAPLKQPARSDNRPSRRQEAR